MGSPRLQSPNSQTYSLRPAEFGRMQEESSQRTRKEANMAKAKTKSQTMKDLAEKTGLKKKEDEYFVYIVHKEEPKTELMTQAPKEKPKNVFWPFGQAKKKEEAKPQQLPAVPERQKWPKKNQSTTLS